MPKVRKVCSYCKSTEVLKDAFAEWSVEEQTWVLHDCYDESYCNTCEGYCSLEDEECDESPESDAVSSGC